MKDTTNHQTIRTGFFNVAAVANELATDTPNVLRLLAAGRLTGAVEIGGELRIPESAVAAFMAAGAPTLNDGPPHTAVWFDEQAVSLVANGFAAGIVAASADQVPAEAPPTKPGQNSPTIVLRRTPPINQVLAWSFSNVKMVGAKAPRIATSALAYLVDQLQRAAHRIIQKAGPNGTKGTAIETFYRSFDYIGAQAMSEVTGGRIRFSHIYPSTDMLRNPHGTLVYFAMPHSSLFTSADFNQAAQLAFGAVPNMKSPAGLQALADARASALAKINR